MNTFAAGLEGSDWDETGISEESTVVDGNALTLSETLPPAIWSLEATRCASVDARIRDTGKEQVSFDMSEVLRSFGVSVLQPSCHSPCHCHPSCSGRPMEEMREFVGSRTFDLDSGLPVDDDDDDDSDSGVAFVERSCTVVDIDQFSKQLSSSTTLSSLSDGDTHAVAKYSREHSTCSTHLPYDEVHISPVKLSFL